MYKMYDDSIRGFGYLALLFLMIVVAAVLPVRTEIITSELATLVDIDETQLNISHKYNISGGLFQTENTDISFIQKTSNETLISKNMVYTGDITYEKSTKNKITYAQSYNIYGQTLNVSNIKIEYDDAIFEK